jgi:hypothetical protein
MKNSGTAINLHRRVGFPSVLSTVNYSQAVSRLIPEAKKPKEPTYNVHMVHI